MEIFLQTDSWIALLTLTLLEVVLGIDNIIFISIISNRLPAQKQRKARNLGLSLALLTRVALLFTITWIIGFTQPVLEVFGKSFSGRDLILAAGGVFLIAKSTSEIHHKMEVDPHKDEKSGKDKVMSFGLAIAQILALDVVFSFDSILTAVGMTEEVTIMIVAVVISMIIMMIFAGRISAFINKHPSLQILALSFLILIGFMLLLEGFGLHVPKAYIYSAVCFSLIVELINMRVRAKNAKN